MNNDKWLAIAFSTGYHRYKCDVLMLETWIMGRRDTIQLSFSPEEFTLSQNDKGEGNITKYNSKGLKLFKVNVPIKWKPIILFIANQLTGFYTINPFWADVSILYSLKTPENQGFSCAFRGYEMET